MNPEGRDFGPAEQKPPHPSAGGHPLPEERAGSSCGRGFGRPARQVRGLLGERTADLQIRSAPHTCLRDFALQRARKGGTLVPPNTSPLTPFPLSLWERGDREAVGEGCKNRDNSSLAPLGERGWG